MVRSSPGGSGAEPPRSVAVQYEVVAYPGERGTLNYGPSAAALADLELRAGGRRVVRTGRAAYLILG